MEIVSIAALVVAVLSAGIAVWQGITSRSQLSLARLTEGRTNDALEEIRRVSRETRDLTENVKSSIDERISRMLDLKFEADAQSQATSKMVTDVFMQGLKDKINGLGSEQNS